MKGLLEIVGLEVMTESVGAATHLESWRQRLTDSRSCDACVQYNFTPNKISFFSYPGRSTS